MPDLPQQLLLLVSLAGMAAIFVAMPLLPGGRPPGPGSDELETAKLRHRLALEALRDVEADRRAGSLDDDTYRGQREAAEARAVVTRTELDAALTAADRPAPTRQPRRRPRLLVGLAGIIGAALLVGFVLPAPIGLANPTIDVRQQAIDSAQAQLKANPRDTQALSKLADAYLAGSSYPEMQRGAATLIALLALEPKNTAAYNRLISTYIRVGDWSDARAATLSLAGVAPDSVDVPFFQGLIALDGDGNSAEAARQFDLFLQRAPNDPRVPMVPALRDRAASATTAPVPSMPVLPEPASGGGGG